MNRASCALKDYSLLLARVCANRYLPLHYDVAVDSLPRTLTASIVRQTRSAAAGVRLDHAILVPVL